MSHPVHSLCKRRMPPFPGPVVDGRRRVPFGQGRSFLDVQSEHFMMTYLSSHPDILESYIEEYISIETMEEWIKKKKKKQKGQVNSTKNVYQPHIVDYFVNDDILASQQTLMKDICEKKELIPVLHDMANVICKSICAKTFAVYIPRPAKKDICVVVPKNKNCSEFDLRPFCALEDKGTVISHVSKTQKTIRVKDTIKDERFPKGTGVEETLNCSVIAGPVVTPTLDTLCIVQFTRPVGDPFTKAQLQTVTAFLIWIGIGIYQSKLNKALTTQSDLNSFLLDLTKIIFDDVIKMDKLVEKIMMFTKELVNAERCALFLVDTDKEELYAHLFDEGKYVNNQPVFVKKDEIRFPMHKGIAGAVATSGEIINIADAYADPRFNKDVDKKTGYTTKNVLCMPIVSNMDVIGVVQMVNKKNEGGFTNADVQSFKMFSVYSALALHYSKMYRDLVVQTALNSVGTEQLNYHGVCEEKSVNDQMKRPLDDAQVPEDLEKLEFYIEPQQEPLMNKLMVRMITKLAKDQGLEIRKMYRFILTVKKNYRPISYHNWIHGWSVAHSIYVMFRIIQQGKNKKFATPLIMMAYTVAALAHDVDHRGYNNQFMVMTKDPLAVLYENSTMERHHYAMTIKILQRDQHNIFSHLPPEDYKAVLQHMEDAIMATDLAVYLRNMKSFSTRVVNGEVNIFKEAHRTEILAVMMTAADLCSMLKPWAVHKDITLDLYEEFWNQGDFEKLLGKEPLSMMDREKKKELPKNQVGFMEFVCMPCFSSLALLFPELKHGVQLLDANLKLWAEIVAGKAENVWEPAKSRPDMDAK